MKRVILLTGTIDTSFFGNTGVKLTDLHIRLNQYLDTIYQYITDSVFDEIVFAENSGYPLQKECIEFENLAKQNKKSFEYIIKRCNVEEKNKIQLYGKSYGEASLISYAIHNSRLLENAESFYKVTGRVFLKNSNCICKSSRKNVNEFVVLNKGKWCYTVFFHISKSLYLQLLDNAAEACDESKGKDIETVYYDRLFKTPEKIRCFNCYPDLTGTIGTIGNAAYDQSKIILVIKNILIQFGFFSVNRYKIICELYERWLK